jgi:hypothetical protein
MVDGFAALGTSFSLSPQHRLRNRVKSKTRVQDWFHHPTNPLVDVAALPFPEWQMDQPFPYDHILIPFGNAPSKEVIRKRESVLALMCLSPGYSPNTRAGSD